MENTATTDQLFPPQPPVFAGAAGGAVDVKPSILSLDDIFDEYLFSSDRPQVRSSGHTEKKGGLEITENYKDDEGYDSIDDDDDEEGEEGEGRNKKRTRGLHSNMTEEQKIERRYGHVPNFNHPTPPTPSPNKTLISLNYIHYT